MSTSGSRVERLINLYFNQLLHGCGSRQCLNPDCASSSRFIHGHLSPNQAAAIAIRLTSQQAQLCYGGTSSSEESSATLDHTQDESTADRFSGNAQQLQDYPEPTNSAQDAARLSGRIFSDDSSWGSILPSSEVTRLLMLLLQAPDRVEDGDELSRDGQYIHGSTDRSSHNHEGAMSHEDGILPECSSSFSTGVRQSHPLTEVSKRSRTDDTSCPLAALVSSMKSVSEQNRRTNGLTLEELKQSIGHGNAQADWSNVLDLVSAVFGSYEALSTSFPAASMDVEWMRGTCPNVDKCNTVQDQSTFSPSVADPLPTGDNKSHEDNYVAANASSDVDMPPLEDIPSTSETPTCHTSHQSVYPVNIHDVRSAWSMIAKVPEPHNIVDALMRAVRRLVVGNLHHLLLSNVVDGLEDPHASGHAKDVQQRLLNLFIILYECPFVKDPSHFEHLLLNINRGVSWLPITLQARLCRVWAYTARLPLANESESPPPEQTSLWALQRILLQHITLRCLTTDFGVPNEDKQICEAALVLRIVYYASILAGQMDSQELLEREARENAEFEELMREHSTGQTRSTRSRHISMEDPLEKALGISFQNCRQPLIPAKDFVNETLNEAIKPKRDYINYRSVDTVGEFSFMRLPFLLQIKIKSDLLHFDSRMRMMEEQRGAFVLSLFGASQELPYLKLHVSRDRIIEDTLLALEITCLERPGDLKKQLLIEFEGEQGVDEGGLSKEFFQLIIEKVLDPVYGMFVANEELGTYWFNPEPLDDLDREYCLIGILMGLAIYNDVILNVRFPSVLYRKLSGKLATYEDLKDARPDLIPGLQSLLEYEEDDFEEAFDCHFVITYQDAYGNSVQRELVPGGSSILVTKSNRQDFVERYADFLLNSSVKKQFTAFRRGFQMVVDESPLNFLFRADEIELLVRGSQDYDFHELERVTKYDTYTADSPVIRNFWTIVHQHMTKEQQRQLLQFATGSDRIPAGGMSQMKFTIARQGADPNRLPTAHTCFNILLLPDYETMEQLQRFLFLAIAFCKGFGMS